MIACLARSGSGIVRLRGPSSRATPQVASLAHNSALAAKKKKKETRPTKTLTQLHADWPTLPARFLSRRDHFGTRPTEEQSVSLGPTA